MRKIVVIKQNLAGEETWRYTGLVLSRRPNQVLLEARFNRSDLMFHGILFGQDDLFIEVYYSDRWFNIFEIYDKTTDVLKGWYCNVAFPARFNHGQVSYVDLALDLLVYPDGRQLVLDQGEFEDLRLPEQTRKQALAALVQLQQLFFAPVTFRLRPSK